MYGEKNKQIKRILRDIRDAYRLFYLRYYNEQSGAWPPGRSRTPRRYPKVSAIKKILTLAPDRDQIGYKTVEEFWIGVALNHGDCWGVAATLMRSVASIPRAVKAECVSDIGGAHGAVLIGSHVYDSMVCSKVEKILHSGEKKIRHVKVWSELAVGGTGIYVPVSWETVRTEWIRTDAIALAMVNTFPKRYGITKDELPIPDEIQNDPVLLEEYQVIVRMIEEINHESQKNRT